MDDSFLIEQVLAGRRDAYRFLVLRYQRSVFRFLSGFVRNREIVEELAQEAFVRAYRGLASYDSSRGATFATWLFTIARNLALNELARSRKVTAQEATEAGFDGDDGNGEQLGLVESLERNERKGILESALDRLPGEFRSALMLFFIRELSLEEIARIEECSLGTVKSRIFRGKLKLRKLMEGEYS